MKTINGIKQQQFHKVEFQQRNFLKLQFPELTLQDQKDIREWAHFCKYKCIIDENVKKAMIINEANHKVAYIQKVKGDIRLVFKDRFESITNAMRLTPLFKHLKNLHRGVEYRANYSLDSLIYSLELS